MKRKFLGDSYDIVKRFWRELLHGWAPIYAAPQFVPAELQEDYVMLLGIPMLAETGSLTAHSILNDPDTGIRMPSGKDQSEGRTHITLGTIARQLSQGARCVVTFDQSNYRNLKLPRELQHELKRRHLAEAGVSSFYYDSHAPFLFATADPQSDFKVRRILRTAGVPDDRITPPLV